METTTRTTATHVSPRTDFGALLSDLDGGVFQQKLDAAVSDAAINTIAHGRKGNNGKVVITLEFSRIGDSNQVVMGHSLLVKVPQPKGYTQESNDTETPLHVARGGRLTLMPETGDLFRNGENN